MFTLLGKLVRTRQLTPTGIYRWLQALWTTGTNLMSLLRVAAHLHPRQTALVAEGERLTYPELWRRSEVLAAALSASHGIRPGQKVAVLCQNHAAAVQAIFALSRLGTHVFLANPEMSADQLFALEERHHFAFYVQDEPLAAAFATSTLGARALPAYSANGPSIHGLTLGRAGLHPTPRKAPTGSVVVMTGGTTGQPKAASRKPSIGDYLPPFNALLTQIHLDRYRVGYIGTPIYHGFGMASLVTGVALGMEMHFTRRFDAGKACALVAEHRVELMTLVPLQLSRMLGRDAAALASLQCILTGAAPLSPALATETLARLGPILFNLYGTSEGGFAVMATPAQLARKPDTIGRPVSGVRFRLLDAADREVPAGSVGRLCLRSAWTTSKANWIETGDLARLDPDGDLFLCGRTDDMIVSAGENVYPIELENVLVQHPGVASVAVVGIPDVDFGQRLKAVVVPRPEVELSAEELLAWLRPRVSRHQLPARIELRAALPYTPLGKLDRKALRE